MIFVTLGSQKFQFNRLLIKLDELVEENIITQEIFAQTGSSDYRPKHYPFKPFMDRIEFSNAMSKCDIVITHGGTGAIVSAIKQQKKVIAIPRMAEYGEHVDNHQTQLIEQFTKNNFIYGIQDCNKLKDALMIIEEKKFHIYQSNTKKYTDSIEKFLKLISIK